MGGSSGSSFSSSDMAKLQAAAEERLRAIASKSSKILFACEQTDRGSLDALLARTPIFSGTRALVVDASQAGSLDKELDQAPLVVVFTDKSTQTTFLDKVTDAALLRKLAGVHVQAKPGALIPSKVTAYRWRSMSWNELVALFK
jgi:hypothetical protein